MKEDSPVPPENSAHRKRLSLHEVHASKGEADSPAHPLGVAIVARFVRVTSRLIPVVLEREERVADPSKPLILALWHGDQIAVTSFLLWSWRASERLTIPQNLSALISKHQDGRFAASVVNRLGIGDVPGSSSSGGTRALVAMVKTLRSGGSIAITVDGPRGPVEVVKGGILSLAQHSSCPIQPIGVCVKRGIKLKSWDSMQVPLPWSALSVVAGNALSVPKELSEEQFEHYRHWLEQDLKRLHTRAASL